MEQKFIQGVKLGLLLFVLSHVASAQKSIVDFDCRRNGIECHTGKCDPSSQNPNQCSCSIQRTGYDCALPADTSLLACPTLQCENGGTCYQDPDDNNTEKCHCPQDFGGDTCSIKRVEHTCESGRNLRVSITPHGDFDGFIYLEGRPEKCRLTVGRQETFAFDDALCGESDSQQDPLDRSKTNRIHVFNVIVQYSQTFTTSLDQKIKFMCSESADGTITSLQSIVSNVDLSDISDQYQATESRSELPLGITLELRRRGNPQAIADGDELDLGEEVDMIFSLDSEDYPFMEIVSVLADNNAVAANNSQELDIISNGCASEDAKAVLVSTSNSASGTRKAITITFRVFKFSNTDSVKFTAQVKACQDQNTCFLDSCSPEQRHYLALTTNQLGFQARRKRRSADLLANQNTEVHSMNVALHIKDLEQKLQEIRHDIQNGASQKNDGCLQNVVFLLPLVLLAAMLLISMAMTLYFCMKVTRPNEHGLVNSGYKA